MWFLCSAKVCLAHVLLPVDDEEQDMYTFGCCLAQGAGVYPLEQTDLPLLEDFHGIGITIKAQLVTFFFHVRLFKLCQVVLNLLIIFIHHIE